MVRAFSAGALPLTGFQDAWLFSFLLVPVALLGLYALAQIRRRRRIERFSDPELLGSVAPRRPNPWRHVPIGVLLVALVLLTVALAGPTREVHLPRNRAVIMLVIDVSKSMDATDVAPTRLAAARQAAKRFAEQVTPGVNLGLVAFAGTADLLVSPTPEHEATVNALDNLRTSESTAIGQAIFTALQAISTVSAVMSSGEATPPPARIVLLSDGKETKPGHPDNPRGAYTGARAAKDQGVPISTIAFGTKDGYIEMDKQRVPVPVNGEMLKKIAELSGGQYYTATNLDELNRSYAAVQQQVGYQTVTAPASAWWLRLAVLATSVGVFLALGINRRLPT